MPIPFEILIRGHGGSFRGAHVIDEPGGNARRLTLADLAILAPDINVALAERITELENQLANRGDQQSANPKTVEVGGLTLRAEDTDRALFTQLLVMLNEAERFGMLPETTAISDNDGALHELPTNTVRQILVGYGAALQTEWIAAAKLTAAS